MKPLTVAWRRSLLPAKCFTTAVSFGWHHLASVMRDDLNAARGVARRSSSAKNQARSSFFVGNELSDESAMHPDCWGGGNYCAMAETIQNLKVAVRKRIEEFEPIARSRTGVLTFSLVTSDSLQTILRPTFLDRFSASGLRKFDRIEVNADCLGAGERATLLVEENLEGKVKVRQL